MPLIKSAETYAVIVSEKWPKDDTDLIINALIKISKKLPKAVFIFPVANGQFVDEEALAEKNIGTGTLGVNIAIQTFDRKMKHEDNLKYLGLRSTIIECEKTLLFLKGSEKYMRGFILLAKRNKKDVFTLEYGKESFVRE